MPDPTTPTAPVINIRELVAQNLAGSGPKVKEIVVNDLTGDEINKRTDVVRQALPLIDAARGQSGRFKADIVTYNGDGTVKDTSWSKQALDAKKKAEEDLAKLEAAFAKALNDSDFEDLTKLVKQAQNTKGQAQGKDKESKE